MSAIVGAWFPDGRPVGRRELEGMLDTLRHRGPDADGVWTDGLVGLGHAMLWTTPESLNEKNPHKANDGGFVITADARIDNREELIEALGIKKPPVWVTDSELILEAYRRWGRRCAERLIGDFAFAIWDPIEKRLFCARDHFGVRPFFYHHAPGRAFVFGSEIKALLHLPCVPRTLNEEAVAEYLDPFVEGREISATFYGGILRLPPAHTLCVTGNGLELARFYSFDPGRELRLRTDAGYAEAFREILTESVRCRLRSAYPIGSELSGGLDSSSVVCTAAGLLRDTPSRRLHTFTSAFDGSPRADESRYVRAVLRENDVIPHIKKWDGSIDAGDIKRIIRHQDEPSVPVTLLIQWPLYRAAREAGVRVLLDGFDGDTVIQHGVVRFVELLLKGRLATLASELQGVAKNSGTTTWQALKSYVLSPLAPESVVRAWRFLKRRPNYEYNVIGPGLAARYDMAGRRRAMQKRFSRLSRSTRAMHMFDADPEEIVRTIEIRDSGASAFSLELRHPFFDRRLVEFCLALPPEQRLKGGWTRVILRRAMEGALPEEVRLRFDKANLSQEFMQGLLGLEKLCLMEVVRGEGGIRGYVDGAALKEIYGRYDTNREVVYSGVTLWNVVMLERWLRGQGLSENAPAGAAGVHGGKSPVRTAVHDARRAAGPAGL